VVLSSGLAFLAALSALVVARRTKGEHEPNRTQPTRLKYFRAGAAWLLATLGLTFVIAGLGLRLVGQGWPAFLELRLSPYKSYSYILQQPGVEQISQEWNAYSRWMCSPAPASIHFPG